MASAKTRSILLWSLTGLLAAMFLMSGSSKLANSATQNGFPSWDAQFEDWGLPAWSRILVGLAEVAGAIGILVPALRFYAASGLTLLMVGGVGTHIANAQWAIAPVPLVLAVLVATLAWFRRPAWLDARLGRSANAGAA